ncbi:MAG: hypothetical protein A3C35_07415 [Omnitrophica bacterium RIFCSPHIGHO2_02_FULL_46_11]|nr:MAG: hypothetical protein A3C35_07415 [Omnitrophica bacterium RIFCSPHIGHO2_02_FULL_46_11]OGW87350.1 MAG: hypothetical protein A3A81_04480 [Omnitrophica bacterium RIFCSPLOWO2_01_FULL_45_10b]
MKKTLTFLVITALFISLFGTFAQANHGEGKSPAGSKCSFDKGGYHGGDEKYECPIVDKLMGKARFFLSNEKELGLSEDQVKTIKELTLETKKAYIRNMAEYQIFALNIHSKLSAPELDVAGIEALIDQGSASMASSAKETITAYAKLKSVLTPEQLAKAKELHSRPKA